LTNKDTPPSSPPGPNSGGEPERDWPLETPPDVPEDGDITPDPNGPVSAYDEAAPRSGTRRKRPSQNQASQPPFSGAYEGPPRRGGGCADFVTAIFLMLTVAVLAFTVLLLANPQSLLNPLRPPTLPNLLVLATDLPTHTPTFTFTPEPPTPTIPTATPTLTETPTETPTPTFTFTPVVGGASSPTPAQLAPTARFTRSALPFTVKTVRNEPYSGSEGCKYQSVGGFIIFLEGLPPPSLVVRVQSADGLINEVAPVRQHPFYGPTGFEVYTGQIVRKQKYTVQVLSATGQSLSEPLEVETQATCTANVTIIEFEQNHSF
jgi:hypothetical protein